MTTVGEGKYSYEVVEGWGRLPTGWTFGMISGMAVDSKDRVYALQRKMGKPRDPWKPTIADMTSDERAQAIDAMKSRLNTPSVLVFDKKGDYLSSWDHPAVGLPHNIFIDARDAIYISDRDNQTAMKFTQEGKLMLELGTRGRASDTGCIRYGGEVLRPGGPFNMPGKFVSSPSGDLYVADGDRNCRVHRFSADGKLIASWGTPGDGPGQFRVPHSLWVDREGQVYVCDRANNRIQVFSSDGKFITQWKGFSNPTDIYMDADETVYVTGQGKEHRISVLDKRGNLLARWAPPASNHGIWGDSAGNLYIALELQCTIAKYVRK